MLTAISPDPASCRKQVGCQPSNYRFALAGTSKDLSLDSCCVTITCQGVKIIPLGYWGLFVSGDKDDDDDDDADEKMQSSGIPDGGHIRQESQEQSEVDHGDFEMVVSLAAGEGRRILHFSSRLSSCTVCCGTLTGLSLCSLSRWSWKQLKMSTMATPLPWRPCWQVLKAFLLCWTSHLMQMTRPWLN